MEIQENIESNRLEKPKRFRFVEHPPGQNLTKFYKQCLHTSRTLLVVRSCKYFQVSFSCVSWVCVWINSRSSFVVFIEHVRSVKMFFWQWCGQVLLPPSRWSLLCLPPWHRWSSSVIETSGIRWHCRLSLSRLRLHCCIVCIPNCINRERVMESLSSLSLSNW